MISQVAEFIEWVLGQQDGENTLAEIMCVANTKQLMESLAEVSQNMVLPINHRHYAMQSVIVLDDHLEKEGWYSAMKEDKESTEEGCDGIAEQLALDKFNARLPL